MYLIVHLKAWMSEYLCVASTVIFSYYYSIFIALEGTPHFFFSRFNDDTLPHLSNLF